MRCLLGVAARKTLHGRVIGYIDAHQLESLGFSADAKLWTRDRRLYEVALALRLAMTSHN